MPSVEPVLLFLFLNRYLSTVTGKTVRLSHARPNPTLREAIYTVRLSAHAEALAFSHGRGKNLGGSYLPLGEGLGMRVEIMFPFYFQPVLLHQN